MIVYPKIHRVQLFDLQADPNEIHDLSTAPELAGEIERLTLLLRTRQAESSDSLPLRSEKPLPEAFDFTKIPPTGR